MSGMHMKKQNVKTYVLIALIISSVVLTGKIWFNEKLWPEGYNFFAVITDNFSFGDDDFVSSLTKETISFPQTLVVTNLEKRSVYGADSESFEAMVPDVKELLRLALENSDKMLIGEQEWSQALKTQSIHVTYSVAYDSKLFLNILGSYKTDDNSIPVREFIISSSDLSSTGADVYMRRYDTAEILKTSVMWKKQRLVDMINTYALDSIGDLSYSSELNFDQAQMGEGARQKVLIESNVLILLNKRLSHMLEEFNPLYQHDYNTDVVDSLLTQFGYNVSGARKYTERDNSIVFVENYSTLKLHPNGLVEYKAVDAAKGIDLGSGNDFYEGLLGCVDFVNRLWGKVLPSEALNINISSDVIDTKTNSFRLTMDYFADGAQVSIDMPQSTSHPSMNHGVEIEVVGGKIVSYRQALAYFESVDMATHGTSAIEALDKLMAETNMEGQVIKNLYPVYIADGTTYRKSAWAARTADGRTIIIN